jgi:1-acyl-sn-glycerol-3-phosphate acyltransferase
MIVYPLLSARRGRALGRYVIMAAFRFYLASLSVSRRCSFDLKELDALRDQPSLIIAPNHPCMLDAVMVISRLPNVACVLKSELMNNMFLGVGARLARYIRHEPRCGAWCCWQCGILTAAAICCCSRKAHAPPRTRSIRFRAASA